MLILPRQWRQKLLSQWFWKAGTPAFQALLEASKHLENLIPLVRQALLRSLEFSQLGFQVLLLIKEFFVGGLSLDKLLSQIVDVLRNLDFQGFQLGRSIVMGGFPCGKFCRQRGAVLRERCLLCAAQ